MEQTTPPSPPRPTSTRHESLSPSPPSKRPATEHVRHASLCTLPSTQPPLPELSSKCESEDMLGPSLHGAVRARVLDIEEKGRDPVTVRKQSCASEKSDVSIRSSSPTGGKSDLQLTQRPASVSDEPTAVEHTISSELPQDTTVISADVTARLTRRESTPPAVFSAWRDWISREDVPPLPVQDLKQRFEYSDDNVKVGGALRRSQSLRTMEKPRQVTGRASTSSPEQGAGPSSESDQQ